MQVDTNSRLTFERRHGARAQTPLHHKTFVMDETNDLALSPIRKLRDGRDKAAEFPSGSLRTPHRAGTV